METKDLIVRKAEFDDWKAMYRNVWSHPETARYMMWRVTETEEAAQERIRRTIEFQKAHDTFFVYEKKSGQPIGFAGWEELAPHSFRETGIALGPEYVGRGYGKQIVNFLLEYCRDSLGGNFTIMPEQKIRPPMPWRCPAVSFISARSRGLMTGMGRRMSCGFIEKS